MDARGGKLLEFLKENNHLDLELPDIAFSIKKSEKTVEAALQKLQQRGFVTARQNEYGRVYWYALPSAPITRTFKLEELSTLKEEAMKMSAEKDDEVDLSELQNVNVQPGKKIRKSTDPSADVVTPKKTVTLKNTQTDIPAIKDNVVTTPEMPLKSETPKANPVPIQVSEEQLVDNDEGEESIGKKINFSMMTLPALLIIGFLSIGALLRSCGVDSQFKKMESMIPKDVATATEVKALKTDVEKITTLDKKIESLSQAVDSLQTVIVQMKPVRRATAIVPASSPVSPPKHLQQRKKK